MSEKPKEPTEPTKVVRKLVVPPEPQIKAKDGDRSPTKTERDLTAEVPAEAGAAPPGDVAVVRDLVGQESASTSEEGDRSPTKTERDLVGEATVKTNQETTQTTKTVRKPVAPEE